ncbi:hypothetical protein S83_056019 [Arachis hypogaea]
MKNKGKATVQKVGGPPVTSKDDSSVEEAKQMPAVTEEAFSTSDDPVVDVFNKVREILLGSDGATRSIVETQAGEIKKLKRTVDGHGTLLEILWSEYAKGRERPLTHQERYGSTKGVAIHDAKKQKMEWHRKPKLASDDVDEVALTNDVDAIIAKIGAENTDNNNGTRPVAQSTTVKQQPLKRRLEFVSGNDSSPYPIRANAGKEVPLFYRVGAPGFMDGGDLPHVSPITFLGSRLCVVYTTFMSGRNNISCRKPVQCIEVVFRPPAGVNFMTVELAIAAYVFGRKLSMKEVLIPNEHCQGDRQALWTLRSGEEVVDDVLTLLATMLTDERADRRIWWLPTTFAETLSFIREHYMGRADDLTKARYIQQLLREGKFYERPEIKPPQVTNFKFLEPATGQQAPNSNDCGIWVAQWMELSHLWGFFDLERVDDETRMRLAVDLVMSKSNPKRKEVCQKAGYFWDNSVKSYLDSDGCDAKDGGQEDAAAGSMSSQSLTI